MLNRLIAKLLLWSLAGCGAWFAGHAYVTMITGRLEAVSRALGGL